MQKGPSKPQVLPLRPVTAWSEEHALWASWAFLLALVPLMSPGTDPRVGAVDISSRGLTISGATSSRAGSRPRYRHEPRFIAWNTIARIDEASASELATVTLNDGSRVVLRREHVPRAGGDDARAERIGLLRHGLELSRSLP